MNQTRLLANLKKIAELVADCQDAIASGRIRGGATKKTSPESTPRNALPDHILRLRDGGFFRQSKTAREVHAKLRPTYECDVDRVAMALLRLRKRNQLRKASKIVDGRKQVAYVR